MNSFAAGFLGAVVVALPMTAAVVYAYNRVPPDARFRLPVIGAALLAASAAGVVAEMAVASQLGWDDGNAAARPWTSFIGTWPRYALLGALFSGVHVYIRDRERNVAAARNLELDRGRLARQMEEAQLALLEAQIEPHFLFNTLATVRRLYETDPAVAAGMLDNLMSYLGVALKQMRANGSTLGQEAALAEAYLRIQQVRMGRRLQFEIDIPEPFREAPFPSAMLLTLAENSIKHGISPLPEGGYVRISAVAEDALVKVQVADSGRGFGQECGAGTGLANIQTRLRIQYGTRGRLSLAVNPPRGVIATVSVPLPAVRPHSYRA
jgi:LytS/YehU family sensor histidine kinase